MIRTRMFLAAVILQSTYLFSQVQWTRDDLFLDPSGIPADGVTSFALADMDGDGAPDFVLALDSILVLYRQIPNNLPRFQKVSDYFQKIKMPRESYIAEKSGVALYDFDGDGVKNPITYQNDKFIYWRNAGNRQIPIWRADSLFFPEFDANDLRRLETLIKPSCGDLDGDGDADLMTGRGASGLGAYDVIFFENVGTNTQPKWKRDEAVARKFRGGYTWRMPRITDINNDGKADVAITRVVESSVSIQVLIYPSLQQLDHFGMPLSLLDMEFADLDNDGTRELIALLPGAGWRIYKRPTLFAESRPYHWGAFQTRVFALPYAYDFDRDGRAEFTLMNFAYSFVYDDHCFAEHYQRAEFFGMSLWQDRGWLQQRIFLYLYSRIGIADLTGRRNCMLVASVSYPPIGHLQLYTYHHTGSDSAFQWQEEASLFQFFKKDKSYQAPAFADLDGDRDSDLLILHGKQFEFFENQFNGGRENWIKREDWMNGLEASGEHAGFGDLDRDGDFDVAFGTANGKLRLFDNAGSSSQPRWRKNSSADQFQFQAHTAPALGDFDGDGDADLLLGWAEGDSLIHLGYQFGRLAYFRNDFTVGLREPSSPATPANFELMQIYPNPFMATNGRHHTRIQFVLREAGQVRVDIYNLLGQRIITLVDAFAAAGAHSVIWNGRNTAGQLAAPGIYLIKLERAAASATRKLLLLE